MSARPSLMHVVLAQFTGSETWHRHGINRNVQFTEGAKYLADHAGAHWLIDEIAVAQGSEARVAREKFQAWQLKVNEDRSASLVCGDGDDNIVYTKRIAFTDFPLDEITLWFVNNVIHLPSEH